MSTVRRAGRPPTGRTADGIPVKVGDFPRLTVLMDSALKSKLESLSDLTGKPAYSIVAEALERHIAALPAEDRRLLDQMQQRKMQQRKI